MMKHRLTDHTTRVKPCRDGGNCSRQNCWYKHEKDTPLINSGENEATDNWINNELDSENEDFPPAQKPAKPPSPTQIRNATLKPTPDQ